MEILRHFVEFILEIDNKEKLFTECYFKIRCNITKLNSVNYLKVIIVTQSFVLEMERFLKC